MDSTKLQRELVKMSIVDRVSKKLVRIRLEDKEGNNVELSSVITELLSFISQKMNDTTSNQFTSQILPLVAQTCTLGLIESVGPDTAAVFLTEPTLRDSLVQMMCVSFLLLKVVTQKELTIVTEEESLTDAEIQKLDRLSAASSAITQGLIVGLKSEETLEILKKSGNLTEEDIAELRVAEESDEEE